MKNLSNTEAINLVRADVVSRRNALNGKYKAGKFGLDFWEEDYTPESAERVKRRADLADKVIAEAESAGQDTTDLNILRGLGDEVNAIMGRPVPKSESLITAILVALQLIFYYGVAIGIWGLTLNKSILWFSFYGGVVGMFISLLSVSPVIAMQRTKERIKHTVFGVSVIWGNLAILIGILGLVFWVIRLIFFNK